MREKSNNTLSALNRCPGCSGLLALRLRPIGRGIFALAREQPQKARFRCGQCGHVFDADLAHWRKWQAISGLAGVPIIIGSLAFIVMLKASPVWIAPVLLIVILGIGCVQGCIKYVKPTNIEADKQVDAYN